MNLDSYFSLYANCIAVKGKTRATVCDLQRGNFIFISNELADILLAGRSARIRHILEKHTVQAEYLEQLYKRLIAFDLGDYFDDLSMFPEIDPVFLSPYEVQDCIIELSDINLLHSKTIFTSLALLGCQFLELRAYDHFEIEKLNHFLRFLTNTRIRNVEIYLKSSSKINDGEYEKILQEYPIIGSLIVHSAAGYHVSKVGTADLVFTRQAMASADCCGNISKDYFKINLPFYLQGKSHNTCLFKKISISSDGNIQNCPSISRIYGNISHAKLEDVIHLDDFRSLWDINKDQIEDCRVCEFRYICSDCRAFLSDVKQKPAKCRYNPNTGQNLHQLGFQNLELDTS